MSWDLQSTTVNLIDIKTYEVLPVFWLCDTHFQRILHNIFMANWMTRKFITASFFVFSH